MKAIKNNNGSAMPLIIVVIFFLMAIAAGMLQTYSLTAAARSVRAAMQQTAQAAIGENSEETYGSKRESYAGAYNISGISSAEELNIKAQLQSILGLIAQGDELVKYDSGGKELYRIKNIVLQLQNPPHKQSTQNLVARLTLKLVQPAKYGDSVGNVTITLSVKADNPKKFM